LYYLLSNDTVVAQVPMVGLAGRNSSGDWTRLTLEALNDSGLVSDDFVGPITALVGDAGIGGSDYNKFFINLFGLACEMGKGASDSTHTQMVYEDLQGLQQGPSVDHTLGMRAVRKQLGVS